MITPSATLLERLSRLLQNSAHTGGLKPTQWEALRYLARANRFSRSPGALTSYLGMTKGTVSQTLQALERKGLVSKQSAVGDRRAVRLHLTEAGEARLADDPLLKLDAAIYALPPAQRDALEQSLQHLVKEMLGRRGGRPFGPCRTCRHFRGDHQLGQPYYCGLLNETLTEDDSQRICAEQNLAA